MECPYQRDHRCRKNGARDPISFECIQLVHKLLNYCYERRTIRAYVEKQLYEGKLPVDVKRQRLPIEEIALLLSFSSQQKLVRHFVHVASAEQLERHMVGATPFEDQELGETADMYLGKLNEGVSHELAVLDADGVVVLLGWNEIDQQDMDLATFFEKFQTLYKLTFAKSIFGDDQQLT